MQPYYLLEETLLRRNLELIHTTAEAAGVEFILAFKAFALWKSFPIFKSYVTHTTASSPYEARLASEEFGSRAHTYSPAYEDDTFDTILECSSHVTFNSLGQLAHFAPKIKDWNRAKGDDISIGIRINPEYSEIETALYDPCAPGSRFGILSEDFATYLEHEPKAFDTIHGFHCHCHCESNSYALERTLEHIESRFGKWLDRIEWLNLGGGHLVTRKDYDVEHLIHVLRALKSRHPHLHIILEPGSAFAWQTGPLVSQVVDIVENKGIRTAILNVSFTCHMPDCLEMPYWPTVRGAETLCSDEHDEQVAHEAHVYRLGGNSCLSGDFMGFWRFDHELQVGEQVIFEDMIHYTTVKTNMFNGIHHPAIILEHTDGTREVLRQYAYEDYRDRMC